MRNKLLVIFIITLFLAFMVDLYHGMNRDYQSIVTEIRGPHWIK